MLRAGMADPPAMIGQDALRGTVLGVAPETSRPVLWQVLTLARPFDRNAQSDTLCSSVSVAPFHPPVLRQGAVLHAVSR